MAPRYPSDSSWTRTSTVPRREAVVKPRRAPATERIHEGWPARRVAHALKALRQRDSAWRLRPCGAPGCPHDAPFGEAKSPRPRDKGSRR
jgi:hypothetical protein